MIFTKSYFILFVFSLLLLECPAHSSELFNTARVKARGNTYTAQYFGDHSARFNPAILAETQSAFQFRPLEINAIVGENVVSTVTDITDHDFSSNNSDAVIDFIRKFQDKFGDQHYINLEAELLAVRVMKLEVMPFVSNKSFIELRRPTIPQFDFNLDTLAGVNIAYGHALSGNFKLGMAVRPTFRTQTEGTLTFTDILDLENADAEEISQTTQGTGVGVDVGAIWNPTANFRMAATVQNIGGMGYLSGDDKPEVIRQQSNLGLLYRIPFSRWEWNLLFDLQGIENWSGIHWSRLLHFGTEFGTKVFTKDLDFGLASGIEDGYFSYGLFADIWLVRLEISKFWQELDKNPGMRGDERIAISMRTSMSF